MLVENPHDFACVHCGTAAECNDAIGLECLHLLCALFCTGKCRVRSNVEERRMNDTHFVKLVCDRLCIAVMIKEAVRYDERSLLAHDIFKLVKCNRETALLDIYLFRCSEPQHILSPFSYGLDIDKMLYANILADTVAAP